MPGFGYNNIDDLVLMSTVSQDEIVRTLEKRFGKSKIYTYIGEVLLCVNPFKNIAGIHGPAVMDSYADRYLYEMPPSVYAVAESSFRALLSTGKNQCILVSGESGAGKTYAAKKVLEYLAHVSSTTASGCNVEEVKDRLLQSNPLLEAFGNAKTLRNDNSSRFGKYIEVIFNYAGAPLGGRVRNYLLEKPRVVGLGQIGERNFHIFYQLCEACANGEYEDLGLGAADCYQYLVNTQDLSIRGVNDLDELHATIGSMQALGYPEDLMHGILAVAACVLNLGNITFTARGEGCVVSDECRDSVQWAAFHLGVEPSQLEAALTHKSIDARGEHIVSPQNVEGATYARDALAKALYARNFQRILKHLNASLEVSGGGGSSDLAVGVLDIYGFEIFEQNSFEQLCINYCNEKLQQLFIQLTLKAEQEEYNRENIPWQDVDYVNNEPVCKLIEGKRPPGVLALLDEACILPTGSDRNFIRQMDKNIRSDHMTTMEDKSFTIRHYAGDVTYVATGFLDKNKDQLLRDLIDLVGSSTSGAMRELVPEATQPAGHKRPPTTGTLFKKAMAELLDSLLACQPHYIRCIKPNAEKKGGVFTTDMVADQVRYLGLLENVHVRRAGYSFRETYERFFARYRMLAPQVWPNGTGNAKADSIAIMEHLGHSGADAMATGKTKLFIRKPQTLFALEELRERALSDFASMIQKAFRGYRAVKFFLQMREKALGIFKGRKRRSNSIYLRFNGDYIGCRDSAPLFRELAKAKLPLETDPVEIVFADEVSKVNRRGKAQQRFMVLTHAGLYILTPSFEAPVLRSFMDINAITGLSLSTFADNFVFVHEKDGRDLMVECRFKSEFVALLSQSIADLSHGRDLPLTFSDSCTFQTHGSGLLRGGRLQDVTVLFSEDASAAKGSAEYDWDGKKTAIAVKVHPDLGSNARMQLTTTPASLGFSPFQRGAAKAPASKASGEIGRATGAVAAAAPLSGVSATRRRGASGGPPAVPPPRKRVPPVPAKAKPTATALYDYTASGPGELTLAAGAVVVVKQKTDGGWWEVTCDGKTGYFPSNYLQES